MNCDRVFEILTAGPFPSGQPHDAYVESHLLVCHDCRQLAEALRPALELFHESIDPNEVCDLPGYHGSLGVATRNELPMTGTLSAPHRRTRRVTRPRLLSGTRPMFLQFVSAVAIGMLLCYVVSRFELGTPPPASPVVLASAVEAHMPSVAGHLSLVSLKLPTGCYRSDKKPGASRATNHCCIECHSSRSPADANVQPVVLAKSCSACHTE